MQNHYELERQVNVVIATYHRDSATTGVLRVTRAGWPGRVVPLLATLRDTASSLMALPGDRLHRKAAKRTQCVQSTGACLAGEAC